MARIRGVVLDIEGTTTPIAFVHDVLFSYARTHVKNYLATHADAENVRNDIELLRAEHAADVRNGNQPPPLTTATDSVANYVNWLIDLDRKSTGLKSLQGKIWHDGYADGALRSQVFPDVAPAFARWRTKGVTISIFSSGSTLAQQLLFAHTEAGDLTSFISNYFDTSVGKKGDPESYRRIAEAIRLLPGELLFVSDVTTELAAANEAGMETALSLRPDNQPQEHAEHYQTICSFDEL